MELQENLDQLSKVERNNEKIMGSFKRMETGLAENTAHMEKVIQNNEKVWCVFVPITKNYIKIHKLGLTVHYFCSRLSYCLVSLPKKAINLLDKATTNRLNSRL